MDRLAPASFSKIIDNIEYQKAYLFRIILPTVTLGTLQLIPKDAFELCTSSTSFPSMSSAVQAVAFYNSELKVQTKTTYSNWSATFKLDANNQASNVGISVKLPFSGPTITAPVSDKLTAKNTYEYFYQWQLAAYNTKTRTSYLPKEYKKPIELMLLNELTEEVSDFTLEGAFPIQISGGSLDYSSDSILTYSVEFAFDRYIVNGIEAKQ